MGQQRFLVSISVEQEEHNTYFIVSLELNELSRRHLAVIGTNKAFCTSWLSLALIEGQDKLIHPPASLQLPHISVPHWVSAYWWPCDSRCWEWNAMPPQGSVQMPSPSRDESYIPNPRKELLIRTPVTPLQRGNHACVEITFFPLFDVILDLRPFYRIMYQLIQSQCLALTFSWTNFIRPCLQHSGIPKRVNGPSYALDTVYVVDVSPVWRKEWGKNYPELNEVWDSLHLGEFIVANLITINEPNNRTRITWNLEEEKDTGYSPN